MPAAIATAAITTVVAEGTFAALASSAFAKAIAINLAIKAVGQALSPKASRAPQSTFDTGSRTQSIRQPVSPRQVLFGSDRISGPPTFHYENYLALGFVYTFTGHRVKAIRMVYFGTEEVPLQDIGWEVSGRFNGAAKYEIALGSEVGQPFPILRDISAGTWTDNHLQAGCAKLHFWMRRGYEVFNGGIPAISALCDGYDQVYDPRTASYGFTNNSALVAACYLTTAAMNKDAVDWTAIDETALIAAANICDERISTVYQPAFTANDVTDVITFTADELQLDDGDAVKYVSTGTPTGGLASGTVYYFIRTDTDAGQLAYTRAEALAKVAINLTSPGTGTHTLERMPVFTVDVERNRLTFEASERRLEWADGVRLETTNTLPGGFSTGTTYYVIPYSDTQIQLATSVANAFAGTAINITDLGTGTHRLKPYNEARYTTNGTFYLDQKPQDILSQLEVPMAGHIYKVGGKWVIMAGAYTSPSITFGDGDMDGPRNIQVMAGRQDSANGIKGLFVGRENFWQPTDFVPVTDATYLTEDNDERVWKDTRFYLVRGHNRTRRLAKIELRRIREGLTITLQGKLSCYRALPGETVGLTVSRYGWSNKAFEVLTTKPVLRGSGDNLHWGVDMTLQAISSDRYDYAATEGAASAVRRNTSLPDPWELARQPPPRVTGLELFGQGSDTEFTGRDCKIVCRRAGNSMTFDLGSEPEQFGIGAAAMDPYIDGLLVKVYKTDDTLLRTELVRDPYYVYTYEKNHEDTGGSPVRELKFELRWKTKYGLVSEYPAWLTVSNPAPAAIAPTITATIKGLRFQFATPNITDFDGFKVYGSTSNGFTANSSTLIYDGKDNEFTLGTLAYGTTYYYKYLTKDTFGDGTISSQQSTTAGVLALTKDLEANAATSLTSSAVSGNVTMMPASGTDIFVLNYLSVPIDLTKPCDLTALFNSTLSISAASNNKIEYLNLYRIRATARWTQGSITSITESGGSGYLNGSGTGWLSAGFTVGDKIILANGYPLMTVFSVVSDTQIEVQTVGAPPVNSYSGSYIGLISGGASAAASAVVNITAGESQPVSINLVTSLPSSGGYTEEMLIATAQPTSSLIAGRTLTSSNSLLQALKSIR